MGLDEFYFESLIDFSFASQIPSGLVYLHCPNRNRYFAVFFEWMLQMLTFQRFE